MPDLRKQLERSATFGDYTGPPRHHATNDAWFWLEHGEGLERADEDREHIADLLRQTDAELHKLDELRPVSNTGREHQ